MFRRIVVLLLCGLLCLSPALAAHREAQQPPVEENPPESLSWIAIDPHQQAIADYWSTLAPAGEEPYLVLPADETPEEDRLALPSVTAPYAIGALDPSYVDTGLRYLNFLRWLAGLQQVTLSDHLCVQAQYGAVLLAANDTLTHSPDKPADMEASFYRMGANACATANLSMRYGYPRATLLQSALQGHMDEDSARNRLDLGHRRWLLNPRMGKVGFGLAASATERQYIVVPVSDSSGAGGEPSFVTWPSAGQFPNQVFAPGTPWSIHLNPEGYQVPQESQLHITVTRARDGKVFVPPVLDGQAQLNGDSSYLLVSINAYGSGFCISFSIGAQVLGEETYLGDYTVRVEGLYTLEGIHEPLEYTVRFFDAEQLSLPSDWAVDEVAEGARLGLIPESLTDFYQQPITRLEFCRLTMQVLRQKTGLTNEELMERYGGWGLAPVFRDCEDPEVLAAAAIGVVQGMGGGIFQPEGLISRQDAAVMLSRAAAAAGLELEAGQGLIYGDSQQIAPYAATAVQWVSSVRDGVSAKPVMAGVGAGRFDPLGLYTREQAMLTVLRLYRMENFQIIP